MAWKVERPSSLMVEQACALFNATRPNELPDPSGQWGVDDKVWNALIELTKAKCRGLGIPVPNGSLKGMCIWASAVAAKFYVHRFAYIDTRVMRVHASGDHYFVVVKGSNTPTAICDITCNQFAGPDYITGRLADIKSAAQKVKVGDSSLYDAYALGAASDNFVM